MVDEAGWVTVAMLLSPFLAAAAAPLAVRLAGGRAAWALALVPAAIVLHLSGYLPVVRAGGSAMGGIAWAPSLGLSYSWLLDGLSLTFALLIAGVGVLIVLYSGAYLKGHAGQGRFLAFLFLFMGAMLGLVVSDSLLMLFFHWELTSFASFLLIGFDREREAARRAALQALVITGAGGLALLAGAFVLEAATGETSLSAIIRSGDALRDSSLYMPALLLVLLAAFTKSAQTPFNLWLPNAMQAPTPVSAYLHSATMVKAGVYLLLRLNPVLGGTLSWQTLLMLFGGTTLLVGAVLALRQTDLKLVLAQTTVASLGLMVMLIGVGTPEAIAAATLYLLAHALFKGALFMTSGTIGHETGSRDIDALGGLRRVMPATFVAALIAAFSMAGLPPLFGFLAKEAIYGALTGTASAPLILALIVAIAGNAMMVAAALRLGLKPFVGTLPDRLVQAHEGAPALWAGPLFLATAGLAASLFSVATHAAFTAPMASAAAGRPVEVDMALGLHPGLPLLLSALTVGLGLAVSARRRSLGQAIERFVDALGREPDRGFDHLVAGLVRGAERITRVIQNGRLDIYMTVTFAVFAGALLIPMALGGEWPAWPAAPSLFVHEWAVLLLAAAGAIAVVAAGDRLTAALCLGIQGFAVALIFLLFGAPDLAFTQFMIETLSVVILALVLTRLKLDPADRRPVRQRLLDVAVASACGAGFGLLLLKVTSAPFDDRLTRFYEAASVPLAHGRNIVNVIIVDFRGLDTLGEIAVVMAAGLAILAVIRIRSTGQAAAP